jgi:hypothetical protein
VPTHGQPLCRTQEHMGRSVSAGSQSAAQANLCLPVASSSAKLPGVESGSCGASPAHDAEVRIVGTRCTASARAAFCASSRDHTPCAGDFWTSMCAEPPSGSQLCNSRRLVLVCSMELSMSPVAADRRSGGIVEPVCMRARKRHAERRGCANARAGGVGASTRKKLPVALDRLWFVVIFAARRKPILQRRHPVSSALGVRRGDQPALAGT